MSTYSEANIIVYKGLEAVRQKPGMYLGAKGSTMLFKLLDEIVTNAVDEYHAGRNNKITVVANTATNDFLVADCAGGIPVGLHATERISTLTLVFSKLHAGGKFDDSAYKTSGGTHGCGAAAVNAVCDLLEVWTCRNSSWHYQKFSKGKQLTGVVRKQQVPDAVAARLGYTPTCGTVVHFVPDVSIVAEDGHTVALDTKQILSWLRDLSLLNTNLRVVAKIDDRNLEFFNQEGLTRLVRRLLKKAHTTPISKVFVLENPLVEVAFCWASTSDERMLGFVNSVLTRDGGKHLDSFYTVLVRALSVHKKARETLYQKDVRCGLFGVVNYRTSGAEFSSQTKDRFTLNIGSKLEAVLEPALNEFFAKYPRLTRSIIKRIQTVASGREEFKRIASTASTIKKRSSLPSCLAASLSATPATRELFIVEGQSASLFSSTPILLGDGTTKTIADLAVEYTSGNTNFGWSYDIANQQSVPVVLEQPRITNYTTEFVEVELEDGSKFLCTPEHLWLLSSGIYKRADALTSDDDIQTVLVRGS